MVKKTRSNSSIKQIKLNKHEFIRFLHFLGHRNPGCIPRYLHDYQENYRGKLKSDCDNKTFTFADAIFSDNFLLSLTYIGKSQNLEYSDSRIDIWHNNMKLNDTNYNKDSIKRYWY